MPLQRWLRGLLARSAATRRIRRLGTRAETASPRYRGFLSARAGDLARNAAMREEALRFYGQAIDAYLEAGRGRPAELICERVLQAYPEVIRARCTLALIAIGHGQVEAARTRIGDYLEAMMRDQPSTLAVPALLQMASVTADKAVRAEIAGCLKQLERADLAERVLQGHAAKADSTSWSRSVAAAIRHPLEVDMEALAGPEPT